MIDKVVLMLCPTAVASGHGLRNVKSPSGSGQEWGNPPQIHSIYWEIEKGQTIISTLVVALNKFRVRILYPPTSQPVQMPYTDVFASQV